jgi:hypothetical protein
MPRIFSNKSAECPNYIKTRLKSLTTNSTQKSNKNSILDRAMAVSINFESWNAVLIIQTKPEVII